jgi:hypothetical protein
VQKFLGEPPCEEYDDDDDYDDDNNNVTKMES